MTTKFRVACIQTSSGPEIDPNVETVRKLVREARKAGAQFILMPEVVSMMDPDRQRLRQKATGQKQDRALAAFRELARETGAWLLVGSLIIRHHGDKLSNRSFLLDADGGIAATYDKIHMFDVKLGNGQNFTESASYHPGERAILAATPWGGLGMTVCYDLRFPHLYRNLAQAGADFLTVPSAFTRTTGEAHWHVLLRARAIENGCFVLAPAQCGEHAGGRQSYGHSLIIDPWGEVLADGGTEVGFITADLNTSKVAEARTRISSLIPPSR